MTFTSGDTMDFMIFAAPVFFAVLLPASLAMTSIPLLFILSFGRRSWASRRALAAHIVFGVLGYLVSLGYYALVGVPEGSSSIFNVASFGAFFGAGYGGTAAILYYARHGNNPARRNIS
jgi:hypothetical protein